MKKSKEIIPIRHIALWEIWMVLGAYECVVLQKNGKFVAGMKLKQINNAEKSGNLPFSLGYLKEKLFFCRKIT